jgi:hypothetical protein
VAIDDDLQHPDMHCLQRYGHFLSAFFQHHWSIAAPWETEAAKHAVETRHTSTALSQSGRRANNPLDAAVDFFHATPAVRVFLNSHTR